MRNSNISSGDLPFSFSPKTFLTIAITKSLGVDTTAFIDAFLVLQSTTLESTITISFCKKFSYTLLRIERSITEKSYELRGKYNSSTIKLKVDFFIFEITVAFLNNPALYFLSRLLK